jgi:type IV secretory pathway VirB2 component (pilin)
MNAFTLFSTPLHPLRAARQRMLLTCLAAVALTLLASSAQAATTAADFTAVTQFLQQFANFMTGPFGKAVVVISIIAAFCTWVFAPKDGIFGPVLRVVVAGIAIMNAAVWISQFGGGTNVQL